VTEVDIAETSYLDTGLESVTTYTVSVVDGDGDVSDPSDPSQATTDVEPVDEDFDGTDSGRYTAKIQNSEIVYNAQQQADSSLSSWWALVLFWPVLHVLVVNSIIEDAFRYEYTVDLLSNYNVIDSTGQISNNQSIINIASVVAAFASAALYGALYSVGFGLIAVAENLLCSPEPYTKTLVIGGVASIVMTTMSAVAYCEYLVDSGAWNHATAGMFYLGLMYMFARMILGYKTAKGILSGPILTQLLTQLSMINPLWFAVEVGLLDTYAAICKWTKLVIAATLAFYIPLVAYHWLIELGIL